MEKHWIEALKDYYEPPKAERKKDFLRQVEKSRRSRNGLNLWYMLKTQCRYISKWAWAGSVLFFLSSLLIGSCVGQEKMGMVFALIPFLVMFTISESVRSSRYGMEELEMATCFSLKSIIFVRLIFLGSVNMFVLLLAVGLMPYTGFSLVIYMLAPYLVAAFGGLSIVRSYRGKEGIYMCFAFACVVAVAEGLLLMEMPYLFEAGYLFVWIFVCAVFLVLVVRECYRLGQTVAVGLG